MSAELKLCRGTNYKHAVLFSRARVALAIYRWMMFAPAQPVFLPSNVCPSLANALGPNVVFIPVDARSGQADPTQSLIVQLYGYRHECICQLEIDPLMTSWVRGSSRAYTSIVSFGYSKTIEIGYGGAVLTDSKEIANDMRRYADFWDHSKEQHLEDELDRIDEKIKHRRQRAEWWSKYLPKELMGPPYEQVIPWRVIRRVPQRRDELVNILRSQGHYAGTNYPPLPGCTDPSSIQWGKEVINLWVTSDYDEPRIKAACEIIKRHA